MTQDIIIYNEAGREAGEVDHATLRKIPAHQSSKWEITITCKICKNKFGECGC